MTNATAIYNHGARRDGSDTYYSPKWVIDGLPKVFKDQAYFDPCPGNRYNHIKAPILTPVNNPLPGFPLQPLNALTYRWNFVAPYSYVNPPFSSMETWIKKAAREAKQGHTSLWFTKLDFRTNWGKMLIDRSQWILLNTGYTAYLDEQGNECNSATFQTGFCLFSAYPNKSRKLYDRVVATYPSLWVPKPVKFSSQIPSK